MAAILVLDDVIYSANLGDSKAILCRRVPSEDGRLTFVHLTKDHNPTSVRKGEGTVKAGLVQVVVVLFVFLFLFLFFCFFSLGTRGVYFIYIFCYSLRRGKGSRSWEAVFGKEWLLSCIAHV